jgi:hypothetical protein
MPNSKPARVRPFRPIRAMETASKRAPARAGRPAGPAAAAPVRERRQSGDCFARPPRRSILITPARDHQSRRPTAAAPTGSPIWSGLGRLGVPAAADQVSSGRTHRAPPARRCAPGTRRRSPVRATVTMTPRPRAEISAPAARHVSPAAGVPAGRARPRSAATDHRAGVARGRRAHAHKHVHAGAAGVTYLDDPLIAARRRRRPASVSAANKQSRPLQFAWARPAGGRRSGAGTAGGPPAQAVEEAHQHVSQSNWPLASARRRPATSNRRRLGRRVKTTNRYTRPAARSQD